MDMPVRLVLEAEPEVFTLAVEALRGEALRRRRAAEKYSGELLANKRAGVIKDIRTGAQHVVQLLAEADELEAIVAQIDAGGAPQPQPGPAKEAPSPPADVTPAPLDGSDDGPLAGVDERGHRYGTRHDPDVAAAGMLLAGPEEPSTFAEEDADAGSVAELLLAADNLPPVPPGPEVPTLPES